MGLRELMMTEEEGLGATQASESSLAHLAEQSPTGYRLLYVLTTWAEHLEAKYNEDGANGRIRQLVRIVAGFVPHMADDIMEVPEELLRGGLEQIREVLRAVLDNDAAPPQPITAPVESGGGDAQAG